MEPIRVSPVVPCSEDAAAQPVGTDSRTLADLLRAKLFYARERACQALPDHRALPTETLRRTARWLAETLDAGCQAALSHMLSLAIGLPETFCKSIPLANSGAEEWEICLDVERGVTLVDLDVLAPNRALPSPESASDALHQAVGILVRPLPKLVADKLRTRLQLMPAAKTLGELLGSSSPIELPGAHEPIATTIPRLLNTLASGAIESGIDRYAAAMVTLDPRIVPTGKFYYAGISRGEIWAASGRLYASFGWGAPVPLVDGLDIGSAVCPQLVTVSSWFFWMLDCVELSAPGRRYTLDSLVVHHAEYTRAAASISSLLLAARASQRIRINADEVGRSYMSFFDKNVGEHPGAHAMPAKSLLSNQLEFYARHCCALQARLLNLGVDRSSPVVRQLQKIEARKTVPLFFDFASSGCIQAIGTHQLSDWWPQEFGLVSNWPRHFWQRELRAAGVPSSAIDYWVRHILSGCDAQTSVSQHCARTMASLLLPAITKTLAAIGVEPIQGLGRKERNHGL